MPRPLRAVLALVVTAVMLTGCMKIDMSLTIDGGRDTVNGSLIFAVDKQVLALSGKSPEESFKDTQGSLDADMPKGTRTEVYDDGKFYGQKIIYDNVAFSEFSASKGAPKITHENGRYIFTMAADMSSKPGFPGGQQILSSIEVKITVTFPGDVIEHDPKATVSGKTASWTLKMSENHELRAVSEEGASFPWLLLGAVAGLFGLLVIAGIVVLAIRMNRREQEPALVATQTDPPTVPMRFD